MNKVLISLCFSLLGSFAVPAQAQVKAIMEGVAASNKTILVSMRTGHVVVGSTTSLPSWTLTVSSNNVSTYAPYLALNSGSAGSPVIAFAQNFAEKGYVFYSDSRGELFLNRGGGAQGIAVNAADAVRIGAGGTPLAVISTGTYTPTLTNGANVAASTPKALKYYRIGNLVHVFGDLLVDPTSADTSTQIDISLPIASDFTTSDDIGGSAGSELGEGALLYSDVTNNRVIMLWTCSGTANRQFSFSFAYPIQ